MRKILAILAFVILSVLGVGFAEESASNNLPLVGQQLLLKEEGILKGINQEVNDCLQKIAEGDSVNYKQLWTVEKEIDKFDKAKEKADELLEPYALATTTQLDPFLRNAVNGYFSHFIRDREEGGKVRRFFVRASGKDLLVESHVFWPPLAIFAGLAIMGIIFFVLADKCNSEVLVYIGGGFLFVGLIGLCRF